MVVVVKVVVVIVVMVVVVSVVDVTDVFVAVVVVVVVAVVIVVVVVVAWQQLPSATNMCSVHAGSLMATTAIRAATCLHVSRSHVYPAAVHCTAVSPALTTGTRGTVSLSSGASSLPLPSEPEPESKYSTHCHPSPRSATNSLPWT